MVGLREYSREFAKLLFQRHPEWNELGRFEDSGTLIVEVPSPNPNAKTGLQISTEGEEVTVGFDVYHTHFFFSDEERENFDQAINFIDNLLSEEYVVLVYTKGDQWVGSRCCGPDDEWPLPKAGERRTIRSWRGTHDAEMAR